MMMQPNPAGRPAPVPGEAPLLSVDNLCVSIRVDDRSVNIVDGVSFSIRRGERVALVGESGSGKSVTARALMRLERRMKATGSIVCDGRDILKLSDGEMRRVRGGTIGMVFQDPMSFLDPLRTIGDQIAETLRIRGVSRRDAERKALHILDELKVERAAERLTAYPHEFSGGMRQRVVLAMALIGDPRLLIADEPTTALDVRVQDQVLALLDEISRSRGLSVLFITHDLGIVAGFADRVMVMYAGSVVEDGDVYSTFAAPRHPYTRGLLDAVPRIDRDSDRLASIRGTPPHVFARPQGCPFHPRCDRAFERCVIERPVLRELGGMRVACHRPEPEAAR
ncbi:MAG: ABC transporter ATP-binding protein [Rhizobiales bacterium 68-8]|nr:MAG: ABC transporter ATP-binding protein [Rhizobiales bacterium 68-8]